MFILDKIREFLFNRKCPSPKIRCSVCPYFYTDDNKNRRCKLIEKYKI